MCQPILLCMEHIVDLKNIRLHYLDEGEGETTLVLMHGLTANAHAFDGLIDAGLTKHFRLISVDLRGRGKSVATDDDFSMSAHAKDIIALLDHLNIDNAIVGGHSFGALLTFYLAAHYPSRVRMMILLDAAARMHPNTKEMLKPALGRLGQTFSSFNGYIELVRNAPYMDQWSDSMLSYYQADVKEQSDGTVMPIPRLEDMTKAVNGALAEPWTKFIQGVDKPSILINGPGIYTMDAALLPEEFARETVAMMPNCRYVAVKGNHQTMLYNQGAEEIVKSIVDFIKETRSAD